MLRCKNDNKPIMYGKKRPVLSFTRRRCIDNYTVVPKVVFASIPYFLPALWNCRGTENNNRNNSRTVENHRTDYGQRNASSAFLHTSITTPSFPKIFFVSISYFLPPLWNCRGTENNNRNNIRTVENHKTDYGQRNVSGGFLHTSSLRQ